MPGLDPAHPGISDTCDHPKNALYVKKAVTHSFAGLSQGVRRSVGGLATILGPLWAGGLTDNLYIMMGVMMALLALLMVFNKNKTFDCRVRESG